MGMWNLFNLIIEYLPLIIILGSFIGARFEFPETLMTFVGHFFVWIGVVFMLYGKLLIFTGNYSFILFSLDSLYLSVLLIIGSPFLIWFGWSMTDWICGCFVEWETNCVRFPFFGMILMDVGNWPNEKNEWCD